MNKPILLVLLTLLIFPLYPPRSEASENPSTEYQTQLIDLADQLSLHQDRFWHLLVHYKRTIWGGYKSEEDGPAFFNAPDGKTDPRNEMIETLENFFKRPEVLMEGEEHPQCLFPARYKWLNSKLHFDSKKLHEQPCQRLEGWLTNLDPERITLVFASFYMNNPASMFGHTLLRIDKKGGPNQKLLSYGVNYAATIDTDSSIAYVFKGLFGLFQGQFSTFPYYIKVQEYSDLDSRDLWEYELNLNPDQVNYFLLHLWELGGNYFDYFYFQENCSYHILSLLEVANPELHLTDQFVFQVVPSETVKALTRYDGLISKRVYRPSLLSQMNQKLIQMTPVQRDLFKYLARNNSLPVTDAYTDLPNQDKAITLDAYLDFAQFTHIKHFEQTVTINPASRNILLERSKLGIRKDDTQSLLEFSTPPELGHGSARVGIGFGRYGHEPFEEISLRPVYHDLLAKETGYGKDSQILFFDFTIRHYPDLNTTKLDNLKLIDIISLTPFNPLFAKKSWALSIEVDTLKDLDCDFCNSFKTSFGIGLSFRPSYLSPFLLYSMANVEAEVSGHLESNYRLGGGGIAGGFIKITENWKAELRAEYLDFPLGHDSDYYKLNFNQRYSLSQNLDVRLELSNLANRKEWLASFNYYF